MVRFWIARQGEKSSQRYQRKSRLERPVEKGAAKQQSEYTKTKEDRGAHDGANSNKENASIRNTEVYVRQKN